MGVPPESRNDASAIVDPEGAGPRLFFQRVPEGKTAKNRMHLDVNVGRDRVDAEVERLVGEGASVVGEKSEMGERWVVLADPEIQIAHRGFEVGAVGGSRAADPVGGGVHIMGARDDGLEPRDE